MARLLEELAEAVVNGDGLATRSLYQDILRDSRRFCDYPLPDCKDPRVLAAAASLIELLALRTGQAPPSWAEQIGALSKPMYLVPSTAIMRRLRELCENESPQPLKKRGFLAPPNYLEFA